MTDAWYYTAQAAESERQRRGRTPLGLVSQLLGTQLP